MPDKKYRIKLTAEEQQELKALVSKGRAAAYRQTHARILLLSDEARQDGGMTDEEIARSLQIASATVERVRRQVVWRKGSKRPWGVGSNNAAGRRNWTAPRKPA